MNELRHFWYNTENLHSNDAELDNHTSCVACFGVPTGMNSFDADFQLVRKQSVDKNWVNPKHEEHFYLPQQEVDNFMALYIYYDSAKKGIQIDCNKFQAGSILSVPRSSRPNCLKLQYLAPHQHEVP